MEGAAKQTRVLVLGASGMLGNAALRVLASSPGFEVFGSVRSPVVLNHLPAKVHPHVVAGIDAENPDSLTKILGQVKPDVVINCIGVVKQLSEADDPLASVPLNSLLPHRLARACALAGARLIHLSTDCVFDGKAGNYVEADIPNATDLYGRSKLLGEVDYPNAITLRTSIIGRELASNHGLIDWFLSQSGAVRGFRRAIFSGLPTVELVRVIRDFVIPRSTLHGVFHVSASAISKYDLLTLVAEVYGKEIAIQPDDKLVLDRSLNSDKFSTATGYRAPEWPELIRMMRDFG